MRRVALEHPDRRETGRMTTHMMKERRNGFEIAKCGVEIKTNKSTAPMTFWNANVTCPDCLKAMAPK
jgi:hypothetical protein